MSASAISIHALLAESDRRKNQDKSKHRQFLSTLSLRRATCIVLLLFAFHVNFYPRSPCGERHGGCKWRRVITPISIHALLAESDGSKRAPRRGAENFYPRSPCGERPLLPKSILHS